MTVSMISTEMHAGISVAAGEGKSEIDEEGQEKDSSDGGSWHAYSGQ